MITFDIEHGNLTVNAETLLISAFDAIWQFDKSKKKEHAIKMLKYVFYMADITPKNPFVDSLESQREGLARRDAFRDTKYKFSKEEKELLDAAIAWYEEINFNSLARLLNQMNNDIDDITTYMATNPITKENFESRIDIASKLDKMVAARDKISEAVRKSMTNTKVKGDRARSPSEKGLLKLEGSKGKVK